MVKPLSFKGDKKCKKRKYHSLEDGKDSKDVDLDTRATVAKAAAPADEDDDSWVTAEVVTDVIGPIIIAMPSVPPTCLACDAIGKVFPSEIENIIEGDIVTSEPHDVRQVWVANRVAGTEFFNFKGHHGR